MPSIQILPGTVSNKIAAGEVIERPASIVKELVENSIDAGATDIEIELQTGGITEIVVADDGCGMDRGDLELSIKRHATSKLQEDSDLFDIKTMGFRGEALPSIAAVAKVTIETKPKRAEGGYVLEVEGGEIKRIEEIGCPVGTRIRVSDLFYNLPARRKFLKTPRTELGHIKDTLERLAIANPDVRFQLTADGKEILNALTVSDGWSRVAEVFGSNVVEKSYRCCQDAGEIRVHGLIGDPALAKGGSGDIYWFVNKRPVKDRILNHAVTEAYRSILPKGWRPFSILFVNLPPSMVDVNVHPTKNEVKFCKGSAVHDFVMQSVKKTLGVRRSSKEAGEPVIGGPPERGEESPEKHVIPRAKPLESPDDTRKERILKAVDRFYEMKDEGRGTRAAVENVEVVTRPPESPQVQASQPQLFARGKYSSLKLIGQLKNRYILGEDEDGSLVIIDQHAAHERIGYERLKEGYSNNSVPSQGMLLPEVVKVSSKIAPYLEEAIEDLAKIGWEIEYFGGDSFCIKAVPAVLANVNVATVIPNIAKELAEFGTADSHEERIDNLIKVTACHCQVRGGDRLAVEEMVALFKEMDRYEWSERCPHGRPAVVTFGTDEIGKWFKRT